MKRADRRNVNENAQEEIICKVNSLTLEEVMNYLRKDDGKGVRVAEKAFLTFKEAAMVFGIGEKTLRRYVAENNLEEYLIRIGKSDIKIKRIPFQKHLEENVSRM